MTIADLALLDDLWDELGRGRIYECSIRDSRFQVDGLQDGEQIYIDPRPAILETVLHELLHRRKPRLGERAVERQARKLALSMDEHAKTKWWRAYRRIKRQRRPMTIED